MSVEEKKEKKKCVAAFRVSSLRTEVMLVCSIMRSGDACTNGCHLQAVAACCEIFYRGPIKICIYFKENKLEAF